MTPCEHCGEEVLPGEAPEMMPKMQNWHRECVLRVVAGSAAHQLGDCMCCGGRRHDPPGMTKRAAARLAAETWAILQKASA